MKKVLITQSNYIPWKGYFDAINLVDELIIYDDMQFTKRDWRNRNQIKTHSGLIWLTIPVQVKGKYFQKINETKISNSEWAINHWSTICHNYSKAKNFNFYREIFKKTYSEIKTKSLTEVNYIFIKLICEILGIKTKISFSSEFELIDGKTERLVDLCKKISATDYYSGSAAKSYIEENLFKKESINIHYLDYSLYPEYHQLYGDFIHNVSIIDLLFNEGKDAPKFMKTFK